MIKYINGGLISLAILLFGYFIYSKFFKYVNNLPYFNYINLKNNNLKNEPTFTSKNVQKNRSTIIVYVSTECGSCEKTIYELNKSFKEDNNYILITSQRETNQSRIFFSKFKLNPKIILLNDNKKEFTNDFNLGISIIYPTILVFNKENKLVKVANGL